MPASGQREFFGRLVVAAALVWFLAPLLTLGLLIYLGSLPDAHDVNGRLHRAWQLLDAFPAGTYQFVLAVLVALVLLVRGGEWRRQFKERRAARVPVDVRLEARCAALREQLAALNLTAAEDEEETEDEAELEQQILGELESLQAQLAELRREAEPVDESAA